jgi:hypothetical protein
MKLSVSFFERLAECSRGSSRGSINDNRQGLDAMRTLTSKTWRRSWHSFSFIEKLVSQCFLKEYHATNIDPSGVSC